MSLSLYHFESCPYCRRVRRALRDLGVEAEVELRDVQRDPEARAALLEATGRPTVPVLRIGSIVSSGVEDRWMPESGDIVRYLYAHLGEGREPPLSVRLNPRMVIFGLLMLGFALLTLLR